jgi:hypothetical protein
MGRPFDERLKSGDKTIRITLDVMDANGIPCVHIIEPNRMAKALGKELKSLQLIDLLNGDVVINCVYRCDVKTDKISIKSINNFRGDYYIVWRTSRTECIVIKPDVLKSVEDGRRIPLESEDPGYCFEQLRKLPHMTLQEFIEQCKK